MTFWSDPSIRPKLSFRWFASFGLGTNAISTYSLRTFQKPSFEVAQSEYIWLNDVNYRPGVLSWNPVEITITDIENVDDNNTFKLYNILKETGYQGVNPYIPQSAIEKKKASRALGGDLRMTQIDADGNTIEEWVLINPFITRVDFGQGNYMAEEKKLPISTFDGKTQFT